jgi:uncharacterized membrane protein YbhN (UPF0104 family)
MKEWWYKLTQNRALVFAVRAAIVLLLFYNIYLQVFVRENFRRAWHDLLGNFNSTTWAFLSVVILFMFVNYGFEARKWQFLINKITKIDFITSYKAIFTGTSFAVLTPNRVGEYAGRLFYVKNKDIVQSITVTLIGSLGQILMTIIFGIIGLTYYFLVLVPVNDLEFLGILLFSILLAAALVWYYFHLEIVYRIFTNTSWLERWAHYVFVLKQYSRADLFLILFYSMARYLVFTTQFILLLFVFSIHVPVGDAFCIISFIFLLQTIIPSIAVAELGLRGNLALTLFGHFSTNNLGLISASFGLWFVNIIIPALLGAAFLMILRMNKKRAE